MASPQITATKACAKCGAEKQATVEFFRPTKKCGRTYLRNACRDCQREQDRRSTSGRYKLDPEAAKARRRKHRLANREAERERDRRYYWANKERKSSVKKKVWAKSDKLKARASVAQWKRENPEKARAIESRRNLRVQNDPVRRAKLAERVRCWTAENPEARRSSDARRRAALVRAVGSYSKQDIHVLLDLQRHRCYYCGCSLAKFHCDHFVPLARGGSNLRENIVLSCSSCNCSKGARFPWEWCPARFEEGCTPR